MLQSAHMKTELIRIEKYLAEQGIASRREAQALIKAGLVLINKQVVRETGIKIDPARDKVSLHAQAKKVHAKKETLLINKPRGFVSSKDTDPGVKTVFDSFPAYKHLNTVGRLDKESEGLLLLSNDGLVTKVITSKDHLIEKEYIVTTREDIVPAQIDRMCRGIRLDDGMTRPAEAKKIDKHTFSIVLHEGKKHQIRRMADACKLTITSLKRVRIGKLRLGNTPIGKSRPLTEKEVEGLKALLG